MLYVYMCQLMFGVYRYLSENTENKTEWDSAQFAFDTTFSQLTKEENNFILTSLTITLSLNPENSTSTSFYWRLTTRFFQSLTAL